jgi:predicted amidohydrolase
MSASAAVAVTPVRVADLLAERERMPVDVHVIDPPRGGTAGRDSRDRAPDPPVGGK